MSDTSPWPVELRLNRAEKRLDVAFDNGKRFSLPAEYLRVESPSAEVQGHGPGGKVIVAGRAHVGILDLEPVGNYAESFDRSLKPLGVERGINRLWKDGGVLYVPALR